MRKDIINQVDAIFDWLLANKRVKLKGKYKQVNDEELKGNSSCKWHVIAGHSTKNYVILRNVIQYIFNKIKAYKVRW